MTQNELDRAVARATGESVGTVKRLGFLLAEPSAPIVDPNDESLGGQVLHWDDFEASRNVALRGRNFR